MPTTRLLATCLAKTIQTYIMFHRLLQDFQAKKSIHTTLKMLTWSLLQQQRKPLSPAHKIHNHSSIPQSTALFCATRLTMLLLLLLRVLQLHVQAIFQSHSNKSLS
jgi:hypothetical protein